MNASEIKTIETNLTARLVAQNVAWYRVGQLGETSLTVGAMNHLEEALESHADIDHALAFEIATALYQREVVKAHTAIAKAAKRKLEIAKTLLD